MNRSADPLRVAHDATRIARGHPVCRQVHSVGLTGERDIDAIVYDQSYAVIGRDPPQAVGKREQIAGTQPAVSELNAKIGCAAGRRPAACLDDRDGLVCSTVLVRDDGEHVSLQDRTQSISPVIGEDAVA
jgi:hypothetical protein